MNVRHTQFFAGSLGDVFVNTACALIPCSCCAAKLHVEGLGGRGRGVASLFAVRLLMLAARFSGGMFCAVAMIVSTQLKAGCPHLVGGFEY